MDVEMKFKYVAACATVALGFISYLFYKRSKKLLDAVIAFDKLDIIIVTNEKNCDVVIAELRKKCGSHRTLGFDCEWVTEHGKRRPVAIVQLSSHDGLCALFRLSIIKLIPNSLKELLEDETIFKVGVAAGDDGRYLYQDYSVVLKSTLDIRHLAELSGYETGGLASLSKTLLGVTLDKSWRVRCSDWEAEELTPRQTKYAAIDAYVAIKIFEKLMTQYQRRNTLFNLLGQANKLNFLDLCQKFADVNYSHKKRNKQIKTKDKVKDYTEINLPTKKYPNATRSKPLYHNCFLVAPDGELLCTCDEKKALWYVEKDLAEIVKENPLTVRLKFEPAGRSVGEVGRYYQLTKENKCVVCGGTNSYIRKNIVPREYRKYFPEIMKDHSSHDVVLLCAECHQLSNIRDQQPRAALAALCSAPLPRQQNARLREDSGCKKIRSAARALLYQSRKHVLPEARRQELEGVLLRNYPECVEITEELLKEAANLDIIVENEDYESHGLKVVEYYLKKEGGLLRLEEFWREHFLNRMKPKYMPAMWSIKHTEERLRVKWQEKRINEEDLKSVGVSW